MQQANKEEKSQPIKKQAENEKDNSNKNPKHRKDRVIGKQTVKIKLKCINSKQNINGLNS